MDPDQGQEPLLPFHLQDNSSNPYNGRPLSSQPSYYPQQQHQQLSEEGVFSNQGQQLLSPVDQQQQQQRQQQPLEQVHHIRSPNEYSNYLASDLHKAHSTPQQQQQQQHHQQMQQHLQQQQMQELGPPLGSLHHHHQQQAGHHHFQSPQQQQHPYYHRRHQHDPHQHDQQRQDDLRQQQRHLLPHQTMYSSTPSLEQQQHGQLYMQPHQQQHQISDPAAADPSTPASTAASTMTSGSAASTPLLPSTASLLSPVAFHIPALSQSQGQGQNMGSNLASPPSEPQPGALQPLGMHALSWTTTPATPEQLPNAQDVAQSKRQQQTFLGSDAQAHAHDHAHDSAPAHAHGHGHHPLSPLPPPLSTTLAQAHGHPPSQHPQQQLPARDSPSSPSQAQLLSQHAQDQHHHHQQQSQMWVGMNSDSAFHSPEGVLGQQQQQQQQVRPSLKQSRSFGMETMEHQNQSYPPGYTDHQGMATAMQRQRVQSARQVFARNLMDYTDDYSLGQGQGHPHHQQQQHQQQQHSPGTPLTPQPHGGLPTLVELPLLPSSQLLQQDPQGFAMSMSMMHQKTMSSPASLGPMAMGFNGDGSHPSMMGAHSQDYNSPTDVVSYSMPLHHDNQHHRPISSRPPSRNAHGAAAGGGGSGGPGSIRPAPPHTPHRTSSAGPGSGAASVRPSRRLRTSSMNAVPTSSFGSRSLLSSITSSLGATSLTFPEYPASSSSSIPLTSIQAAQQGAGGGGGVHGREGSGGVPTIAIGLESHNDLTSPNPGGLDYARYSRSDGSSSMGNMGGGHRFGNRISTATGATSMSKSSPSGLSISTSSSSPLQFSSPFANSASASASTSSTSSSSSFNKPTTLSNFMASQMNRKQTAIRNFACSFPGCPKAYTQLHNLKSHERTGHTPVSKPKPFLCIMPGCPKAFSQRKSLAIHIKANHKEYRYKPFKCGQAGCPKAYTQLHNLRTHEKTVHSLDLSRKRIRIPTPPRTGGGSSGGGRTMGGHPYQPQDPASGGGGMDYGARGLTQSQRDMGLSYGHEANDEDDEEEEEEDGEDGEEEDPADGDWRDEDGDGGQYGGPR